MDSEYLANYIEFQRMGWMLSDISFYILSAAPDSEFKKLYEKKSNSNVASEWSREMELDIANTLENPLFILRSLKELSDHYWGIAYEEINEEEEQYE